MAGPSIDDDAGFLSRWSRRKALVRQGMVPAEPPAPAHSPEPAAAPVPAPAAVAVPAPAPTVADAPPAPPPTLADVGALGRDSDYSRFVAPGVDGAVKNAALKKLFTDPHFNVMDGLDTYIDDYGQPDPLPPGMLRQLAQSTFLGLFDDAPAEPPSDAAAAVPPVTDSAPPDQAPPQALPDEDAALRLQPHDAAGPTVADGGAGAHAGRQP